MKRIPSRATWLRRYILQKKYAYLFYIQFEKKYPKNVGLKQQQKKTENIHERISAHLSDWMKPFNDLSNGFNARWHWSTQIIKIKPENEQKKIANEKKNTYPKSQKRTSQAKPALWWINVTSV